MSIELITKLILCAVLSIVVAARFYSQEKKENLLKNPIDESARYANIVPVGALPLIILMLFVFLLMKYGMSFSIEVICSWCFSLFIQISMFYIVLLLIMPWFRKYFSARACAVLWMLPNFAYIFSYAPMQSKVPLVVVPVPSKVVKVGLIIWGIGFASVFIFYIVQHLSFRYRILKNATLVTDGIICEVWDKEKIYANVYQKYPIYISPETKTPLSIGIFKATTKVVLPQREYTEEELHFIFHHEIIHIERGDSNTKFYMMFCTAMCWFNPLMWIAMRNSADDLELSCDETVLLKEDDEARKKYAELILKTAGHHQGFTTCLSATATALQYRLNNVMKKRKLQAGGMLVGIMLFGFMFFSGYVAFAYENNTGAELVCNCELKSVYLYDETEGYWEECIDQSALKEYLGNLEISKVTGSHTYSSDDLKLSCIFTDGDEVFSILMTDYGVKYTNFIDTGYERIYYLQTEIDWNYLKTLFEK